MPNAIRVHRPRSLPAREATVAEKRQRNSRTLDLNSAGWRRLRTLVLSEQPLCPECQAAGYLVPAIEVDHIDNDPTNNLRENLQGLCKLHHGQKTRRDALQKSPATGDARPFVARRAHRRSSPP